MALKDNKAPGVYVEEVPSGNAPIAGVGTSTAGFVGVLPNSVTVPDGQTLASVGEVKLATNLTEFKNSFGEFSTDPGQSVLAHAVQGFLINGGTRCFVTRVAPTTGTDGKLDYNVAITDALKLFEPIDEIAIVAAPGMIGKSQASDLETHCKQNPTRVAILDTPEEVKDIAKELGKGGTSLPQNSDSAALYFPWLQVYDPATKQPRFVPPSGHMAGIYARVDATRGVHKAPANEVVRGALDLKYAISRAAQEGLNLHGVNCIRTMNGNIRVWGARTIGGDANAAFKYLSVRRLFNYLRASIDQGTQWAVFEPNGPDLWAKIVRNVSAFLRDVWATGALFGDKPETAFYVKCDAENNPASMRDNGQVTTEIGVAITRPAEFVVFTLTQKAAA